MSNKKVEATTEDLVNAVIAKDMPPQTAAQGVRAAVLQLGLNCLGGRIVNLTLPNGAVLEVRVKRCNK